MTSDSLHPVQAPSGTAPGLPDAKPLRVSTVSKASVTRLRLLDRHLHPVCFVSLGLLGIAVLTDIAYLLLNDPRLAMLAYWNLSAGLIGGLYAAISGLFDWLAIPSRTKAKTIGVWHASIIFVVMSLFGSSWWIRGADYHYVPDAAGLGLSFLACGLALGLGRFDGELIELLGVGAGGEAEADSRAR